MKDFKRRIKNMFDITLNDIITLYDQPKCKVGSNYQYQCPYCMDRSKNNMLFNPDYTRNTGYKGIVKCYANDDHCSLIMKDITKYKKDQGFKPVYNNCKLETKTIIKNNRWLLRYLFASNNNLYHNKQALEYVCKKWGLTEETILNYGMGINVRKKIWTLPIYHPVYGLRGFETRDNKLKSGKEKIVGRVTLKDGSAKCLAQINEKNKDTEILIIMEGYKDALTMMQYLKEKNQAKYYHILTPSMGIGTTEILLHDFNFLQYKKVIVYLDSDKAGITMMQRIKGIEKPGINDSNEKIKKIIERNKVNKEKFEFIEIKIMNCGCKDFNEHYQKCIQKK